MGLTQKIIGIGIIMLCLTAALFTIFASATLLVYMPALETKETVVNNNNLGLTLLDDKGDVFFRFYNAREQNYKELPGISDYAENAAIASEDKDFYNHGGYSLKAIMRSTVLNLMNRKLSYGGSTITQQLVKNSLLTPERSILRKFQELILAVELERRYSKEEILEMYLNTAYFGEGAIGVENASNKYFSKKAGELSIEEAAFLIALLPSPTIFSPYTGDLESAKAQQENVIKKMEEQGFISDSEASNAISREIAFVPLSDFTNTDAPHFALTVRDKLIEEFGEDKAAKSGFVVKTTLNRQMQQVAARVLSENANRLFAGGGSNGAVVVINPKSGEVKAMAGSVDWNNDEFGKYNMALAPRQPGSAFKPIVYATAFSSSEITPATVLADKPTTFKMSDCSQNCEYKPKNYDNRFRGNVTVRQALANSLNVPSVKVMEKVGVKTILNKAPQLGIYSLGDDASKYGLSLVLGGANISLLEMTNAYATFASEGEYKQAYLISEIKDKRGRKIYIDEPQNSVAWSQEVAFLISSILSDERTRSAVFGNTLNISRPAAVKTGTTDDFRDAWTIGYTPDLVVGVWVGNNNNKPMGRVPGSLGAAPIWKNLMEIYHRGLAVKDFEPPDGIVRVAACSRSASGSASLREEYFIRGSAPQRCVSTPNFAIREASPSPRQEEVATSENEDDIDLPEGIGGGPPDSDNDKDEDKDKNKDKD